MKIRYYWWFIPEGRFGSDVATVERLDDFHKALHDWNRWSGVKWKYSADPFVDDYGVVLGSGDDA